MSVWLIVAGVALVLSFWPQPLLFLDQLFLRFMARSMVRATGGTLTEDAAADRIRRAEGFEPPASARLFAALAFVAACGFRIWFGDQPVPVKAVVALLAPVTAVLVNLERRWWTLLAGGVTGVACLIALI